MCENAALCKVLIASSVSVAVVFVLGICCEILDSSSRNDTANTAARLVESMMTELIIVGSVPLYLYINTYF